MANKHQPIAEEVERLASAVIEAAFRVHRNLGPGLLESVYEECLCYELSNMGIPFERQLKLAINYETIRIKSGLQFDLLVDKKLVVELKAVIEMIPLFTAQTLTFFEAYQQSARSTDKFQLHFAQRRHNPYCQLT